MPTDYIVQENVQIRRRDGSWRDGRIIDSDLYKVEWYDGEKLRIKYGNLSEIRKENPVKGNLNNNGEEYRLEENVQIRLNNGNWTVGVITDKNLYQVEWRKYGKVFRRTANYSEIRKKKTVKRDVCKTKTEYIPEENVQIRGINGIWTDGVIIEKDLYNVEWMEAGTRMAKYGNCTELRKEHPVEENVYIQETEYQLNEKIQILRSNGRWTDAVINNKDQYKVQWKKAGKCFEERIVNDSELKKNNGQKYLMETKNISPSYEYLSENNGKISLLLSCSITNKQIEELFWLLKPIQNLSSNLLATILRYCKNDIPQNCDLLALDVEDLGIEYSEGVWNIRKNSLLDINGLSSLNNIQEINSRPISYWNPKESIFLANLKHAGPELAIIFQTVRESVFKMKTGYVIEENVEIRRTNGSWTDAKIVDKELYKVEWTVGQQLIAKHANYSDIRKTNPVKGNVHGKEAVFKLGENVQIRRSNGSWTAGVIADKHIYKVEWCKKGNVYHIDVKYSEIRKKNLVNENVYKGKTALMLQDNVQIRRTNGSWTDAVIIDKDLYKVEWFENENLVAKYINLFEMRKKNPVKESVNGKEAEYILEENVEIQQTNGSWTDVVITDKSLYSVEWRKNGRIFRRAANYSEIRRKQQDGTLS